LREVSKTYGGLRPLRVGELRVVDRERCALTGFDLAAAEVLINLVTGATLPDSGEVIAFGRRTSDIVDPEDWLALVDRFGIVSERAVLLEGMTTLQNLAMPFSLDVEPLGEAAREQAEAMAREVELPERVWDAAVGTLTADGKARVRLGRALALGPRVLLLEHASARLSPVEAAAYGQTIRAASTVRGTAVLALTADDAFARALGAARTLKLHAATGRLDSSGGWFRSRLG